MCPTIGFFFLTCDQALFVLFLRRGLDPITIQSNHLLGNPRYTLMERLLANLTDLRFLFGFCLARKNGVESIKFSINFSPAFHLSTGQIQGLCCLAFLASSRPCLSHAKAGPGGGPLSSAEVRTFVIQIRCTTK